MGIFLLTTLIQLKVKYFRVQGIYFAMKNVFVVMYVMVGVVFTKYSNGIWQMKCVLCIMYIIHFALFGGMQLHINKCKHNNIG